MKSIKRLGVMSVMKISVKNLGPIVVLQKKSVSEGI